MILALTAAGKVLALVHGAGILEQAHPFLPGSFKVYICIGLLAEAAALLTLAKWGKRPFLTVCLGLAIVFVGYHALQVGLEIGGPCPCLGGFLSRWKTLTELEGLLSFLSGCILGIASFIGLFPKTKLKTPGFSCQPAFFPITASIILWLIFGGIILWFWQGRLLGGDEGMEAAKSLQLYLNPGVWGRVWNDQPPLLSLIGALAFNVFAPSLLAGRILALLFCTLLPIVLGIYFSGIDRKWAVLVAVIFLWASEQLETNG